jgi:hypothetical protein
MSDPFEPSMTLLTKLGSIAVHAEELIGAGRHQFDVDAMNTLLNDPEVLNWLGGMRKMALLPVKRSQPKDNP